MAFIFCLICQTILFISGFLDVVIVIIIVVIDRPLPSWVYPVLFYVQVRILIIVNVVGNWITNFHKYIYICMITDHSTAYSVLSSNILDIRKICEKFIEYI